jgi:hypothetical protein
MEPVAGTSETERATPPSQLPAPAAPAASPPPDAAPAEVGPWRCAADPSVETYLRCGRCEKPICPRCMIHTPVGSRCRACADLRRLPMFVLRPLDYLKAIGAALVASVAAGVVVALLLHMVPFLGILRFFLMAGVGYVVGEAVSRFTGRKRGTVLGVIAGIAAVIGVIVGQAAFFTAGGADVILALAVAATTAVWPIFSLLGLVVAAAVAFTQAR